MKTIKKIIGGVLIAIPFIAMFIYAAHQETLKDFLISTGIILGVIWFIGAGVYLIFGDED